MSVVFETKDHTAIIRINRPEAKNAVNGDVAQGIETALDVYESDDNLWVAILTGTGDIFSAGADLKEISRGNSDALYTERGGFAGYVMRERTKPVIAALNGPALAGGCELAIASDIIIASDKAYFSLPEVKRSLLAIGGAFLILPRAIGMKKAMEMVLTGDPISAEEALHMGLVNKIVQTSEVMNAAMAMAAKIAQNAPLAVHVSRNLLACLLYTSPSPRD